MVPFMKNKYMEFQDSSSISCSRLWVHPVHLSHTKNKETPTLSCLPVKASLRSYLSTALFAINLLIPSFQQNVADAVDNKAYANHGSPYNTYEIVHIRIKEKKTLNKCLG